MSTIEQTRHNRLPAELLEKYLSGEYSSQEGEIVRAWALGNSEAEIAQAILVKRILPATAPDVSQAWARFTAKTADSSVSRKSLPQSVRRWVGYGVAATVTLMGIAIWFGIKPNLFPKQYTSSTYISPAGTRTTVSLNDGTRIVLAPSTQIQVTGQTVNLTGQALFTVMHRGKTPFTVVAGGTKTVVLGTTFAVRAYPSDTVRVVVAEGRVQLRSNLAQTSNSQILGAGEAAFVNSNGNVSVLPGINMETALGWANGKLTFDHTPFENVLEELERAYSVNFTIEDKRLARRSVTGSFSADSLPDALNTLSVLLDVRYARTAHGITFMRRGS